VSTERRDQLEGVLRAGLDAVHPARVVPPALDRLPSPARDPHLFALGKAAPGMALAAVTWLRERGRGVAGGVVAHAGGGAAHADLTHLAWIAGDHPLPGARSAAAAAAVGEAASRVREDDEVLVLVSGGTSSLIAAPAAGLDAGDLAARFEGLLGSGADVREVNTTRRRILRWGGGGLARAFGGARVRCVVLSDVPGGGPHDVGSGPCDLPSVPTVIAADNRTALLGAVAAARARGWDTVAACEDLRGEAARCGRSLAARLAALARADGGDAMRCLVWGGESAVRLAGATGRGGRSQELTLAAAESLAAAGAGGRVLLLAAGTDGRDGPTDAAGAVVGGTSWAAIVAARLDPAAHLARHDAYPALDAISALIRTGPTGTNVADLAIGLVGPA
jgi:hydroxypyruvate reductase